MPVGEPAPTTPSGSFDLNALTTHLLPHDKEVSTLPTALVTGSPDRVPDITIALKSAGFDILAAGVHSPDDAPDLEEGSVDCYVQLPVDGPRSAGGALCRTRDVIAHEVVARFDSAVRLLPLLAPRATVLLVTDGPDPDDSPAGAPDPDRKAHRTLIGVLAEAILQDPRRAGLRATVVGEDRAVEEIAALAVHRPPEPRPWWLYADVDPDLDFADWRASVLCLASLPAG
jgi:hypothetical protein